jgi:hypothetical protein
VSWRESKSKKTEGKTGKYEERERGGVVEYFYVNNPPFHLLGVNYLTWKYLTAPLPYPLIFSGISFFFWTPLEIDYLT